MSKHSSSYYYFTPIALAQPLLELIPANGIESAIDISCGQGALLMAAKKKYGDIDLIGVDVKKEFLRDEYVFYCQDGIKFAEKSKIKYDLILSNPPFGKVDNRELGDDKGIIHELHRKRLECLMLNADFSLMHDNSWLIVILPATMITGVSFSLTRRNITKRYYVKDIILLSDNTFGSHFIKTFALIIHGQYEAHRTNLYRAKKEGEAWKLNCFASISNNQMLAGDWWENQTQMSGPDIQIFRGGVSSSDFSDTGKISVWHCASKNPSESWKPSVRYVESVSKSQREKSAEIGDTLINRIGKYAGYWWVNDEQKKIVTDCLFVVKRFDDEENVLLRNSTSGRLNLRTRGVATQYITKNDVMSLLLVNRTE
jgi:hypothetical protein